MKRDLAVLARGPFDALVVGAGVQGAALARALALRGASVAVIDAGDFGAASSANSLKIIHGGLRYLQHADFARMRESIRARRRWLQLAPQTVRPLSCLMPTRGVGGRSRWGMGAALLVNACIGFDRNRGLAPAQRLIAGRLLSRASTTARLPGIRLPEEATGGALWQDAIAENTDRLTLSLVASAVAAGARAANYVRAAKLIRRDAAVVGAVAEDVLTGAPFEIAAREVFCAAGVGNETLWPSGQTGPWTKALNLVLRRNLVGPWAVAIEGTRDFRDASAVLARGRRNFFVVPWRGGSMIGTYYVPHDPAKGPAMATAGDLAQFLTEINEIGMLPPLAREDIARVHAGVLPASGAAGDPSKTVGIARPAPGLVLVQAVKYTTALEVADRVIGTTWEEKQPLPWNEPPASLPALVEQAVEREMAMRLDDVIFRRSTHGDFGAPPPDVLAEVARLMGERLGWDAQRRQAEMDRVTRWTAIPPFS